MCIYIIFSARRYIAQTAIGEFRISSPKRLGMNKFVRAKSPTGCKFSDFFEPLYTGWTAKRKQSDAEFAGNTTHAYY